MGFKIGGLNIGGLIPKTILGKAVAAYVGLKTLGAIKDIFSQLAGGIKNKTGVGGPFSETIPLNVPNPLAKLNKLLEGIGNAFSNAGDYLRGIGDKFTGGRNIGGQDIVVPSMDGRGVNNQVINQVCPNGTISPQYRNDLVYNGRTNRGVLDEVQNMPLFTKDEEADMAKLKPEDQAMMRLQRKMQRYNQMVQLMTNLLMMDHEAKKAIIMNTRG